MDYFKQTFNEDEWTIYLIDDDDNVIADEFAAAETCFEKKEQYYRRGDLSLATVRHELWHIYFGYCYLGDTTAMTLFDIEEVSAELFADRGDVIGARAVVILEKLEELKNQN